MTYIPKMRELRNLELNLYYFITNKLSIEDGYTILSGYSYPYVISGVYVVDGYPNDIENMKLPTIAIEHSRTNDDPLQIGSGYDRNRHFTVTLFARSNGERDDLGDRVRSYFLSSMTVYDYNQVISSGSYVRLSSADFEDVYMYPVHNVEFESQKYSMEITFNCNYVVPTGATLL
jgi:hypothetical protein